MPPVRPDLSHLDDEIREYIAYLEGEIEYLSRPRLAEDTEGSLPPLELSEPPTTLQILTATANGIAKRTPRHLFNRQRRGGMGVFDLDVGDHEEPAILAEAELDSVLLILTTQARAFRYPLNLLPDSPVRERGQSLLARIDLYPNEHIAAIQPVNAAGYLTLLSERGLVRTLRHHVFGEYMKPGTPLYDIKSFGPLVSAAWTPGDADLFVATRSGKAIRFAEKLIPPQGCPGIRLSEGDSPAGLTYVYPDSGVFMLSADGKGTIRSMSGFSANKSPGSGGKNAMATDELIAVANIDSVADIFIISALSKIIRFQAAEVPLKEGVVQGVNCMSFRGDRAVAMTVSHVSGSLL